ncbi:hypothetical protein Tdes44962_MAKER06638 [Teratosphaeria destructans]|uniref:Uncharacterized protein n=1 Tax=Teratosphaeria destructans TaxID=418781 RepID=A0A9W7T194_9PEZI|nr:hypothetical protein Tdes44962_MAKER06638 [Teratosphaeria destructans]
MATLSRELPMPNVKHIATLNQAHATLLHCYNKVSRFAQAYAAARTPSNKDEVPFEERQQFTQWLDRWERAFTDYLTSNMPSMGNNELTQCRVLKANHLACVVLIATTGPSKPDFDKFETDFEAIVELSGAVRQARQSKESPTSATSSPIAIATRAGLDVQDPLHIVITYCTRPDLRSRANELSLRLHRQ